MALLSKRGLARPACAVLLLGLFASPASHACFAPPREQVVSPDEQIAMATDVSLARVIRASPSTVPTSGGRPAVEYEFEVEERLLGPDRPRFLVIGAKGETRPRPASSDHSDEAFWQRGGGRLHNDPDCVLRPDFVVGETYLVFRSNPATWRGFEHIETVRGRPNPDDRWLSYVKEKMESQRQ